MAAHSDGGDASLDRVGCHLAITLVCGGVCTQFGADERSRTTGYTDNPTLPTTIPTVSAVIET